MNRHSCLILIASFLLAPIFAEDETRWFKGNTHTHTLWSDGNDFPESVADWYKKNGYHFLVLSDHNILSRGEHWKALRADEASLVMEKAARRWGKEYIKTRIHEGKKEVRLTPLPDVKTLLEEKGEFILIEGIELTTSPEGLPVHTNPMNVSEMLVVERKSHRSVSEELAFHEQLVHRHSMASGRPVFWQANHPNYKFALTGEQLAQVEGLDGMEVMNSSSKCFNLGDGRRPSVERIWDIANTLRLKGSRLPPIYGTATDDTHDYHSDNPVVNGPGTAWVMVRSPSLTAQSITQAMRDGDFYASTGVLLRKLDYDRSRRTLTIEVDAEPGVNYRIQFIGTKKSASLDSVALPPVVDENGVVHPVTAKYLDERIGMTLKDENATRAAYTLRKDDLYARVVVHSDKPPHFTYDAFSEYEQKAWTQPVGWEP